jgi:uncharacterized protein
MNMVMIGFVDSIGLEKNSIIERYDGVFWSKLSLLKDIYYDKIMMGYYDHTLSALFGNRLIGFINRGNTDIDHMSGVPLGMCIPGSSKLFVDVDGSYYTCEKVNNSIPIGDVWNGIDMRRIVEIYEYQAKLMNEIGCGKCWALRFCGFCQAHWTGHWNEDYERYKADCRGYRESYEKDLKFICSLYERNRKALNFLYSGKQK